MTNILTFNTGRQYSKSGQRIAAVRHNAQVYFYDVDRGIYGLTNKDIDLTQSAVMAAYDYNDYRSEYLHDLLNVLRKAADALRTSGSVRLIVCCGEELELPDFTNTCPHCGSDYNWSGQHLAPREQWGEETGEHWSEAL